jgi:hypothetical protein
VAFGLLLLTLAVGTAFIAEGVGRAATAFRHSQATWQRGLAGPPAQAPGPAQRLGEALLGIEGRSDVLRAYQDYRAGLANVIPGTVYPQTQARWEALASLRRLRPSLPRAEDRASVDVVLGVIFTAGSATSGQQRGMQTRYAIQAFQRAVREDPANTAAKLDLEVVLRSELDKEKTRARAQARPSTSPPNRRRKAQQDPRGPAPPRSQGDGY